MKIIITFLFVISSAFATLSKEKVHYTLNVSQLSIVIDKGFHLNQEAPIKVLSEKGLLIKASKITPLGLEFDLSTIKSEKFQVSFYVCDDQNTSCELHKNSYEIKNNTLSLASMKDVPESQESGIKKESNSLHFIKDNLAGALQLAKKEKKLVFVDFGANWCPACVRLETEIFKENSFQKITKNLVRVSLNADLYSNKQFFDKYEVKLLPTVIIMDENGSELFRMIDYQPLAAFNRELENGLKNSHKTYDELKHLAQDKDKSAIRALGMRAFAMNDFKEANLWFSQLQNEESLPYAVTQIELNQSAELLKKYINLYPEAYESLDWRIRLAQLDKEHEKPLLEANIALLDKAFQNKKFRETFFKEATSGTVSFPLLELYSCLVNTKEKLSDAKSLDESLVQFREEIKKIKTTSKKPGEYLMIVQYQREAKMPEEENSLKELCAAWPKNYVYHMKLGGFYARNKRFKESLAELTLSTQLESPVSLYHLQSLAKVQHELNLTDDLKKTIALAESLEEAKTEKSQGLLKTMREYLSK